MRSMIVTLTLALCLTVTSQGPSSVPSAITSLATPASTQDTSNGQGNLSAANPAGPAQQKKHGHATPPERANAPQPAATPDDKTAAPTEATPRLLDRWFQAYVL